MTATVLGINLNNLMNYISHKRFFNQNTKLGLG